MRFGHFDDSAREYVITTPRTPFPWINYLGSESFFGLISHMGSGYSFYRDARLRRLTRYRYNSVPNEQGGRFFYIEEGGDYWTPTYAPVKAELDSFECRHGLGYTRITGSRKGIEAELLYLVPRGFNAEVHQVTLRNKSKEKRSIKLFSFVEFCLWNAHDDATNLQRNLSTGEVEVVGSTIYHKTEYRERRNHFAFYHVNAPVAGFDTDRESFVGLYNHLGEPDVVRSGASKNTVAHGWAPSASHCLEVTLAPGADIRIVFMLGVGSRQDAGVAAKSKYSDLANVDKAFAELRDYWRKKQSVLQVKTPHPA